MQGYEVKDGKGNLVGQTTNKRQADEYQRTHPGSKVDTIEIKQDQELKPLPTQTQ